jgi:hypothetical protein
VPDLLRPTAIVCAALAVLAAAPAVAQEAAQAAVAPSQVAPVPPKPPFPNRANDALPSWLHLRGELRERVEGARGIGFTGDRQDHYALTRLRLQATVRPARLLSLQVQAQDARVAAKTIGATGSPFSAPLDLRLAFADVGTASTPLLLRVGRQELAFGEQRLVGHVGWLNAARSFDGVRLTMRAPFGTLDAFAASVVRILPGELDKSGEGNRFVGTYVSTSRILPRASVEPYVFWRRDVNRPAELGGTATLSQTTAGVRVSGRLAGAFDYGVETALQRGSLGPDTIEAWAGHGRLRASLSTRYAAHAIAEYNYASGDTHPTDGVRGTFDVLYPTPHDKYGLADQIGWKNIHHVRTGLELMPRRGLPVTANYHSWWLAHRRDGVYTAGGALLARVPGGGGASHVGQEIDIQVARAIVPQLQLAAGYAYLMPGRFLKEATPGVGFIKLTDMAPLAIAYELGYFEDEGLYVTLEPQANWKVLLDRVIDRRARRRAHARRPAARRHHRLRHRGRMSSRRSDGPERQRDHGLERGLGADEAARPEDGRQAGASDQGRRAEAGRRRVPRAGQAVQSRRWSSRSRPTTTSCATGSPPAACIPASTRRRRPARSGPTC